MGTNRRIDHDALATYLLDWDAWGSLFESVSLVPWEGEIPPPLSDQWLDEPLEQLTTQLRERLLDAAAAAARGARKVGVLVGGTDSCGVLAALTHVISTDQIVAMTFTGEPDDGDSDRDIAYTKSLCKRLSVRLLTHKWTPQSAPIEQAMLADQRPAYSSYMTDDRPWMAALADAGVDTLLAAHAGDSVFGGRMEEIGFRTKSRPFAAARAALTQLPWPTRKRTRARWLLAPTWSRRVAPPACYGKRLRARSRSVRPTPRTPRERLDDWYSAPWIVTALLYNHALTRGFDIPFRDVTLHPPLLQFLASVPIEALNCDGRFRGLYHRAIAPWVTDAVAERRMKSFHDPLRILTPTTEKALRGFARGTELERHGYVDGQALLDAFDHGNRISIWGFLTAEAWLRTSL